MFSTWPVGLAFAALWAIAALRGGATYAAGRGLRVAGDRGERTAGLLDRPAVRRAEGTVRRFGPLAVVLCFATVGVQTAVNAAAGGLRMPLRAYLPALALGACVWATIYVTIGLAVLGAFWRGEAGLLLVAAAAIALVALVARAVRRRLLRARAPR